MNSRFFLSCLTIAFVVRHVDAQDTLPAKAPKPTRHVQQQIEGWTVHVDERLIEGPEAELGQRALKLIASRLADIKLAVPCDKLTRLQQVAIWLDRTHGELTSAQYHPGAEWLRSNGYDEALEKCVHIPDAAEFVSPGHQLVQPWSVLHELAHAYHDQVLGFDDAELVAAWQRLKDSGRYEEVLHVNGRKTRHYAMTNQMEFFAEMTESYFGVNDFFPFNRAELQEAEPELHALLARIWGAPR